MSALRDRGRETAQAALSRGGERVARLDQRRIPHRAILLALPRVIPRRFDPDAAGDLNAVFELQVTQPEAGEPARFRIAVAAGQCTVRAGAAPDANAQAAVGADDLIRLVSGAVTFPELLASDRLELGGDPFTALRFPGLFKLPAR
jgi:hypothetical protein